MQVGYLKQGLKLEWSDCNLFYVANTAKKAMKYERFGNCLTNARQKSRYVFGQNFTDLVYVDRRHSLLTAFVAGSI